MLRPLWSRRDVSSSTKGFKQWKMWRRTWCRLCLQSSYHPTFYLRILQRGLSLWLAVWRKQDQGRMLFLNTTSLRHHRQRLLDACFSSPHKRVMHSAVSSNSLSVLRWIKAERSPLITRESRQELVTMFDLHVQIGMTPEQAETTVMVYCEKLWPLYQ